MTTTVTTRDLPGVHAVEFRAENGADDEDSPMVAAVDLLHGWLHEHPGVCPLSITFDRADDVGAVSAAETTPEGRLLAVLARATFTATVILFYEAAS